MDDPVVLRSLERILAVAIGGLSIYLGYRLFSQVQLSDSEGKFTLPGGTTIYLTRVGPGVFFALFGALVVSLALYKAVTFTESSTAASQTTPASAAASFTGVSNAAIALSDEPEVARQETRQLIGWLNGAREVLEEGATPEERTDLLVNLRRIKLVLLGAVWDEDWGDYALFQRWILVEGAQGIPPEGVESPSSIFTFCD